MTDLPQDVVVLGPDQVQLLRRLVAMDRFEGGYGGSCYQCPFASQPLGMDGSVADWDEVWNDPTEAYFRCSLPLRPAAGQVAWGEYAPCTPEEWLDGVLGFKTKIGG